MKTAILTLSPRKSFSTSKYFSNVLRFFLAKKDTTIIEIKNQKQYLEFQSMLVEYDHLVIVSPVYVDTIPSTALEILAKIESHVKEKKIDLKIYALTNCGFYEGAQCELSIHTIEHWANRCGFKFQGGLGIGAGVMIGFVRVLPILGAVITLIELLFHQAFPYALVIQTLLFVLWSMGAYLNIGKMAKAIKKEKKLGIAYTTIWFCPRFLFVIIASLYWVLASIFWYRGSFFKLHREP